MSRSPPSSRTISSPISRSHQNKSLLRFITCGSVDGKSTLINPPALRAS
ncbi:MAG: hypothetical protein R3C97_00840 [Geminicoccaceae bacterium]